MLLHLQHVPPQVPGARLAEFDFSLDVGVQRLHIVEDQREGDQAGGDGDRAENDRDKRADPQGSFAVVVVIHAFVTHSFS